VRQMRGEMGVFSGERSSEGWSEEEDREGKREEEKECRKRGRRDEG
jgi:hypothetical protein